MNTETMPKRFEAPEHLFENTFDIHEPKTTLSNPVLFRYYSHVINKKFFTALIDAINYDNPTVTIERWASAPPPFNFMHTIQDSASIFTDPHKKRADLFHIYLPKTDHFLQKALESKIHPKSTSTWLKGTIGWINTRKVERITITVNEALNLLFQVLRLTWQNEIMMFDYFHHDETTGRASWQNLTYQERFVEPGTKRRRIRKTFHTKYMRLSGVVNSASVISILNRMLKIRHHTTLGTLLLKRDQRFFQVPLNSIETIWLDSIGNTIRANNGVDYPKNLFANNYQYICDCCLEVYSGERKLLPHTFKDFIAKQTRLATIKRISERAKNLAKYSDDDTYRNPPSAKGVNIPLPFEKTKTKDTKGYLHTVAESVHTYLIRLNTSFNNPRIYRQSKAQGGWRQLTYVDASSVDHWKWDRIEVPLPNYFKSVPYLLKNGNAVLCPRCYDFIDDKYREPFKTPQDFRQEYAGTVNNYDLRISIDIDNGNKVTKRLPMNSNIEVVVHKDHKADPLKYLPGFKQAKNEHKQFVNIKTYDTRGNFLDTIQKDVTLYLGVEIEVTPSELNTSTLSKALEGVVPTQSNWRYFYTETKFLSALVTRTFFQHTPIAIVKHDGTTANGFEIVSIPGTHKWHIEEAWKGFFAEDYENEQDKVYAPASWLCGWANNGGKSKNPIYQYGSERELGAGRRPICGIHIHASREAMTPLTIGKLLYFMNAESNQTFIEKFAGRTSERFAKVYTKPVSSGRIIDTIRKGTGNSADYLERNSKYEALNINTGRNTIEFRIFRSNVTKAGFMRYLDFVHALITWCSTASCSNKELNVDNFIKWCNTQRSTYKYLTRWLVANKYLSVIHEFNPKYHSPILFEDVDDFDHVVKKVEVA